MNEYERKAEKASISTLGWGSVAAAYWNLSPAELVEAITLRGEGVLSSTGALAIESGEFTGKSLKELFPLITSSKSLRIFLHVQLLMELYLLLMQTL